MIGVRTAEKTQSSARYKTQTWVWIKRGTSERYKTQTWVWSDNHTSENHDFDI